ncbi:hypothetical protein PFICI_08506 [Pestalotiopsis fici W106-1]|uniref:Uncharacterized protein n=1 Tax=Pestalotiopsis fici (strain W106-1 / CGMCC3.15140) TaxID=1229662 RepID=W3WXR6_PESFW|nr:uncharacterized protein PFICI_08506 [Pestalotiopsis fici W106-1]ETS78653.1 hypothetical protein PFICI_08506 [Pestalotiopsis fici W106-1]
MFQTMPSGSVEPLPPPFTSFAQFKEALDEYYIKTGGMGANNPRMRRPYHRPHIATERINAHDGTPCVVAWQQYTRGFPDQPEERFGTRRVPFGSFQVYLPCPTTDGSRDDVEIDRDETTSRVAELLESKTYMTRHGAEVDFRDRLDVFGLAVRPGSSREELVSACIAHQQSEIAARNQASGAQEGGDSEFHIWRWNICGADVNQNNYAHSLVVVEPAHHTDVEDEEKWAGDKTTFLFVWFDREERERDEEDELSCPPVKVLVKQGLQQAAGEMYRMRGAGDGIIVNTLEKYTADFGEPYPRPEPVVKRPTRYQLIRRRQRREQGLPSDDEDEDWDDDN